MYGKNVDGMRAPRILRLYRFDGFDKIRHMNRFLRLAAVIPLLATILCGCAAPKQATNLAEILDQHRLSGADRVYPYSCTAGAHRGASVDYLENTLPALVAANEDDRYAFVEFDVQYTKDNQIVVFHDQLLLRVFGSLRSIGNATYAELTELTGGEIPTFSNAMNAVTKKLNIEIKSQGDAVEDERLTDEVVAEIRARGREKDVMISSISPDVIRYISRKYPEMPRGRIFWLTSSTYLHFDGLTQNLYDEFNTSPANYLMLHMANLRNIEELLKLKPEGKTIVFWDFDDTMYIVHKDATDRIWGESGTGALIRRLQYKLFTPSRHPKPERPIYKGSPNRFS